MDLLAAAPGGAVALVDAATGEATDYDRLRELVTGRAERLSGPKSLCFVFPHNDIAGIVGYLTALAAGHAVALADPDLPVERTSALLSAYRPDFIFHPDAGALGTAANEYTEVGDGWLRRREREQSPHPDVAVLLSTSGSTGSPKFVRLSEQNVMSNTAAITAALEIVAGAVAITNLPIHYSYGLSVLNTHLAAGATVVVTDASVVEERFWTSMREHRVTTLAGVPYTYQMLVRLGFADMDLPALRDLTQAGGKMPETLLRRVADGAAAKGRRLFVMYGQTEAAPRMSCLHADDLEIGFGSVGRALAGGRFSIEDSHGLEQPVGEPGEVVYRGPNVMMGYALQRSDLTRGDECGGVLRTGDIGYLDPAGFLRITGRSARFAKLFGQRVSLDDVEGMLSALGPVAAVAGVDRVEVFHESADDDLVATARKNLAMAIGVPAVAIAPHRLDRLPTTPGGKIDYPALAAVAAQARS